MILKCVHPIQTPTVLTKNADSTVFSIHRLLRRLGKSPLSAIFKKQLGFLMNSTIRLRDKDLTLNPYLQ